MAGIKIDKHDRLFSDLIRERADYTCERCGRDGRNGAWVMHCCHLFGRRNKAVRWDTDNAICGCFTCHQLIDQDHEEKRRLAVRILGETRYEMLVERKNSIKKWIKAEKEEMREHYMAELKRIRHERKFGKTGYIEVVNFL